MCKRVLGMLDLKNKIKGKKDEGKKKENSYLIVQKVKRKEKL